MSRIAARRIGTNGADEHRNDLDEHFLPFHCNGLIGQRFCNEHVKASRTLECIVETQAKLIDNLKTRIADLELKLAKARKNSSNSSKSPSSDITNPPAKKKNASGRRKKAKRVGGD